uniref:Uncharacterized protein n=1 Tax=Peronospora matthiolae TaxID=2874970 RepID=A0AAV1UE37_9STRA
MATEDEAALLEPHEEPLTTKGTPTLGGNNADKKKKKRLLPMELRKQRRVAKLQGFAEHKARVPLEPLPTATASARLAPAEAGSGSDLQVDIEDEKAVGVAGSKTVEAETSAQLLTRAEKTATRLDSLYTSSLSGQKRRQSRPGASVPYIFQVASLPLDVVPKTKLSILTAFPYPFTRANSRLKKRALERFVTGSGNDAAQSASPVSNAMRWQQSLYYFSHPADSVPTSMLLRRAGGVSSSDLLSGGLKGERQREETAFFAARWNAWQEAFRDVYMSFRRQEDGAFRDCSFYLRSSDFVVYFQYETGRTEATCGGESIPSIINLCQQHDTEEMSIRREARIKRAKKSLCAVMSRSSGRVRKVLHHLNVAYTMPYVNATETQREAGEFYMLAEERAATRSRTTHGGEDTTAAPIARTTASVENMHGADSLLLFHGHDAVHGLYEFLINQAPMSNQDVPELYALHPFVRASIQSLQVTPFGPVDGIPNGSSLEAQLSKSSTLFRTEISGFCFPSSIARLLTVLKDEWEATQPLQDPVASCSNAEPESRRPARQIALRTYMEAVAGAGRLNAVNLTKHVATTNDQQRREKRQQELEFAKRRLEAVILATTESRYDKKAEDVERVPLEMTFQSTRALYTIIMILCEAKPQTHSRFCSSFSYLKAVESSSGRTHVLLFISSTVLILPGTSATTLDRKVGRCCPTIAKALLFRLLGSQQLQGAQQLQAQLDT